MKRSWIVVAVIACSSAGFAEESRVDFATEIKPIFEARCVECHGSRKQEGGLRLDRRAAALRGGDSYAPAIRPGVSAESPLFQFVGRDDADLRMPPEGEPLTPQQIETIRRWIDQGATWPDDGATNDDRWSSHWSFQPLHRPPVPTGSSEWSKNPIDRFVSEQLAKAGLAPSPESDKRTLIRRLSFDLIGIPPTPEEIREFEEDASSDACERLVDRLLARPQYGERWARHWLDVVRFAESHGFEMNQERPNAWPYRDYVIRSFNDDLPYDRFIREQIAGDSLGKLEATSFLVAGPWDQVKSPDPVLTAQQRADELHDMVSTTGSTFLGLTIGCARCHSHKFDPITQTEYYAVKACLEGVQHGQREAGNLSAEELAKRRAQAEQFRAALAQLESETAPTPLSPRLNVERFDTVATSKLRFTIRATAGGLEPCIDELEVWTDEPMIRNVALASAGAKVTASGTYAGSDIHRLEHVHDGRYGNSRSWISNEAGKGWVEFEFAGVERINRVLWGRDREQKFTDRLATDYAITVLENGKWREIASSKQHAESQERAARRKELEQKIAELSGQPLAYAGDFRQPGATMRLHRGDPTQPREPIAPASLSYFSPAFELSGDSAESERRLKLGDWITDRRNPLTARVMVNRLWQYHFGEGIVATPSDLGINGSRPSHPELLDWLACELIGIDGVSDDVTWTLKRIQRLICSSATYRQASKVRRDAQAIDAGNRLLWRFAPRRLEAESLRDTILAVSGVLDLQMGGPGFDLFEPNANYVKVYKPKRSFGPAEFRRMVYQSKPRMQLEDTFGAFDCPDAGQIAPRRGSSTTPLQALNLLNSPFMFQQAEYFSERIVRESGQEPKEQVGRAFQLALGRDPTAEEVDAGVELVTSHGLSSLTRALFNATEFLRIP